MGDAHVSASARTAQIAEDQGDPSLDGRLSQERQQKNNGHLVDALLVRIIEGEIIPRLMLSHKAPDDAAPYLVSQTRAPTRGEVEELVQLALAQDQTVLDSYLSALLDSGCGLDDILLDLLAPAARRLGELWEDDRCSFVDVTIGLGHLHNALHHLGRRPRSTEQIKSLGKRALLATVPGEQHVFGILIVENFLIRSGWEVEGGLMTETESELVQLVKNQWFAVVGLTLSGHRLADAAESAIAAIRANSTNRDVKIIVGGHTFLEDPDLADKVGADHLAKDALDAVQFADKSLLESALLE